MATIYRCPSCRVRIKSLDGSAPDTCPQCEFQVASERPDDDVVMPFIRSSANTRKNDQLFRDIEAGSEVRAQLAADALGVPVSDMSDMKITNLNDRRDSEIAAMPVVNEVTKHMAATGTGGFGASREVGSQFSQGTGTGAVMYNGQVTHGIEPRAGAKAHAGLKRLFGNQ